MYSGEKLSLGPYKLVGIILTTLCPKSFLMYYNSIAAIFAIA